MATKLPKELYVVWQGTRDPQNPPLGFLNDHRPGMPSFEKKRLTMDKWAYATYKTEPRLVMQNGMYFLEYKDITGTNPKARYGDPDYYTFVWKQEAIPHQPEIWKNDALPGFMVVKSVSRYYTSSKVWRIADPRGIHFEIPTAKMEEIIDLAGIKKGGEIDAKCAWAGNKNLVIVE